MIDTQSLFSVDPWPHQLEGCKQTITALENGTSSVCLTSPTGSGKTHCAIALTQWARDKSWHVLIFTNRILLTQQTRRVFHGEGVLAGVISASMPHYEYEEGRVQIATVQTVLSRRRRDASYWLDADLVLVDEIHQLCNGASAELLAEYRERGSRVVGITATPLGVSNVCEKLIVAGRTRDLQKSGILCYARWFRGPELDTRKITKAKVDLSITENEARKTWGPNQRAKTAIVGNIAQHYELHHPEHVHTLAFAPGVKESLWAARYFHGVKGIRTLHIDGQEFWCDGVLRDRKQHDDIFQRYMEEWRDGSIPMIWNRFVMREGIDEPLIECLILATPVGSYRSFLQMVGRGLRTSDVTPETVKVIDHGGCWWRFGSVNVNVDWKSVYDCDDPDTLAKNRIAQIRETGESLGQACPKCGMVHKAKGRMLYCQYCGHEIQFSKPCRPIIQTDGTLVEVNGEPIKQWKIKSLPGDEKTWAGLYWNAVRNKGGEVTFNQLYQQFGYRTAVQQGSRDRPAFWKAYYPPRDLPFMPRTENDWHRTVGNVARDRLY